MDALDALWAKVDAAREKAGVAIGAPPEGSFTTESYAERYGMSRDSARHQLNRMTEIGLLKTGMFMGVDKNARMVKTRHYWAE